MGHSLSFRLITPGTPDYEAMVGLRQKILREPLGLTIPPEQLQQEVNDTHLAGFLNGDMVTCIMLIDQGGELAKITQMAVAAQCQGKGIGQRMMAHAENVARERGFARITLNARETALEFYRKLGYVTESPRFMKMGLAHWTMGKGLSQI